MGNMKGIVMDGRDIGTVVFPDAELKLFMTASPEVRTKRRLLELESKGIFDYTYEQVQKNLSERDHIDSTRSDSPLKKADDAIVIDNSDLSTEQQLVLALSMASAIFFVFYNLFNTKNSCSGQSTCLGWRYRKLVFFTSDI
jgi:cytidylate kinase